MSDSLEAWGPGWPVHALSTMWSQGRFRGPDLDHDDMTAFAQKAAELGFPHIEINYVIPRPGVEALLASNHVGVSSVHSPCPRVRGRDGRWSEALNLASADPEERALAVSYARSSIDHAGQAGARFVVVHLGGIGGDAFEEERQLRRLYDSGGREDERVEPLRRRIRERRREGKATQFAHARRSLAEIAEHAAVRSVAVGLENRYHYHEFPDVDEARELLADYPPEVAGFWLDVGHAEVLDRLGLVPKHRWLDELGNRCIGSHVHDVDGLADHRAPGHGTADWDHYAAKLPPQAPRVFEINQRTPEDLVAASIGFLRSRGVLPPSP